MESLKAMYRRGVPLINVHTGDNLECQHKIEEVIESLDKNNPIMSWDCINGLSGLNERGTAYANVLATPKGPQTLKSIGSLAVAVSSKTLPEKSVFIVHNPQFFFMDMPTIQAIQNMRYVMESNGSTMAMLVPPGTSIPAVLSGDIMVVEDEPPDREAIKQEISNLATHYKLDLGADEANNFADTVSGFSMFTVRQLAATSMQSPSKKDPNVFNRMKVQNQKVKQIENVPGLTIWDGNEQFEDLAGLDQLIWFAEKLTPHTRLVVLLDEIEKQLGNVGSSLDGGASMGQFGQILSFMEDYKTHGLMIIGSPGNGKSHVAKAIANEAECLCLNLNCGRAKGRFVGETELNTARILSTIKSLASTGIVFVATSNDPGVLAPELKARFTLGTFMVEFPEGEALQKVWDLRLKEFNISSKPTFDSNGWSGRDVRNACRTASMLSMSIDEVQHLIVPTSQQNPGAVEQLRERADGRYLDAAKEGVYRNRSNQTQKPSTRKIDFEGSWTTGEMGVS